MITGQQLNFCRNVVNGDNYTDAYYKSYSGCRSRASARAAAPRLLAYVSVQSKISELRKEVESEHLLTWLDKRRMLAWIIGNVLLPFSVILRAIEIDNKMAGHDKPPEPELNTELDRILAIVRAKKD
jgi:hypothetical protein